MNDTHSILEQVLATNAKEAGGSRVIQYRDVSLVIPMSELNEALRLMKQLSRHRRCGVVSSISVALDHNVPLVAEGKLSQRQAMQCAQDLTLWFANEVIEGRASLHAS